MQVVAFVGLFTVVYCRPMCMHEHKGQCHQHRHGSAADTLGPRPRECHRIKVLEVQTDSLEEGDRSLCKTCGGHFLSLHPIKPLLEKAPGIRTLSHIPSAQCHEG